MAIRQELAVLGSTAPLTRSLSPGSELYHQGEVCPRYFIVLQGWVALVSLLADGSSQIIDFATPGAFLGFQAVPGLPCYHSARCITPVEVQAYSRPLVDNHIVQNPRLAFLICRQACLDGARAHDHLVNLGLRPARERIAHLLLELFSRVQNRLPNQPGEVVPLPITQTDIAQAVGLTGVHVSRTLRILREQRIIRLRSHTMEVLDPVAFLRAAGVPSNGYNCWLPGLLSAA